MCDIAGMLEHGGKKQQHPTYTESIGSYLCVSAGLPVYQATNYDFYIYKTKIASVLYRPLIYVQPFQWRLTHTTAFYGLARASTGNLVIVAMLFASVCVAAIADHFFICSLVPLAHSRPAQIEWNICESVVEIHIKLLNISCGFNIYTYNILSDSWRLMEVVGKTQNPMRATALTKEVG